MAESHPQRQGHLFGAFKGVYTPSILTILGVVMYLRFGWVLGNVGLFKTLLIVTLSMSVTALTALSISALATNMRIGGGGAYFILSRCLGPEAGAAVGLPLFLAQAFGIAFYIAGFSESVTNLLPWLSPTAVGLLTLAGLAAVAYGSADLALRVQFFVLGLIGASLVAFFMGGSPQSYTVPVPASPPPAEPFWTVLAVFFPAVTGIEAGLGMSGDLKEPGRALPVGTLAAVLTSYVVYIAIPVFLSAVVRDRAALLTHTLIMRDVAVWGDLILYGLWGAALSSALGAMLGAPRTLQALARDGVVPRFLAHGAGPGNEPRRAAAASYAVAVAGILAGGLNVIAPALSMFFLTSYGLINLSAALHGLIGSPSWRPTLRVSWVLSLLGAGLCLMVAVMIHPGAVFAASAICAGVYVLMRRRRLRAYWGDLRYGTLMLMARFALYRLAGKEPTVSTWRPNILVLSGSPTARWYLVALADAISHGKGFLTVAAILTGGKQDQERVDNLRESIEEYLRKRQVPALVKVQPAADPLEGARDLIRHYGFGELVPNTILLGETEKLRNVSGYIELVQLVHRTRRNLVIVREKEQTAAPAAPAPGRIDLWWSHTSHNAGLMLALAYLLKTSPEWRGSRLVIKTIVDEAEDRQEAARGLSDYLRKNRVDAEVQIVTREGDDVFETIRASSAGAGMVFVGMRAPGAEESVETYTQYYGTLMRRTDGFATISIVLAAEEIEFDRIFEAPE